jgi:hypothetical protein
MKFKLAKERDETPFELGEVNIFCSVLTSVTSIS